MKRFCFFCFALLLSLPLLASTCATAILVDTSRSVPPEDFRRAQEVIQEYLAASGPEDKVILYAFGNELRRITPEELSGLQATDSYTMLYDAAYDAAQKLDQETADRKSVVIVSDGVDTRSATILEDTAAYVNQRGIAIYGIGVGKVERKTLERIARLTGGKFFTIDAPGLAASLREAQAGQKASQPVAASQAAPPAAAPLTAPEPAVQQSEPPRPAAQPAVSAPATPEKPAWSFPFLWVGGIIGGVIFLSVIGWVIAQAFKKDERTCPSCGRVLESYQTVCPSCPAGSGPRPAPDSTQAMNEGEEDASLIPVELLEKRPVTEEMLSKTFVLMATPILVIRKGKGIGQTFSLNRMYPISIGRSRVNEIKLEDVSVSSQHCRILPENGHHVLYDMGSTNGTFVNDKRVSKLVLTEGDIIKVGETQLLYKVEQQRN